MSHYQIQPPPHEIYVLNQIHVYAQVVQLIITIIHTIISLRIIDTLSSILDANTSMSLVIYLLPQTSFKSSRGFLLRYFINFNKKIILLNRKDECKVAAEHLCTNTWCVSPSGKNRLMLKHESDQRSYCVLLFQYPNCAAYILWPGWFQRELNHWPSPRFAGDTLHNLMTLNYSAPERSAGAC